MESKRVLRNRSVPANILLPHLTYTDVAAAIVWLEQVFGFIEHYRYGPPDGAVEGAQLQLGEAWIMLNSPRPGRASPAQAGTQTQSLTIFVEDVSAHYLSAQRAAATILEDLHETTYGEKQFGVQDLEGHRWLFSSHVRDVDPSTWGAIVKAR